MTYHDIFFTDHETSIFLNSDVVLRYSGGYQVSEVNWA